MRRKTMKILTVVHSVIGVISSFFAVDMALGAQQNLGVCIHDRSQSSRIISSLMNESINLVTPQDPKDLKRLSLQLTRVKGRSLLDSSIDHFNYDYSMPNELMNSKMEPELGDGALVSVGTFRALNLASSGKVSHLVLLDYNKGIKIFNLINLQLIKLAKDRFEYLSLLTTGQINESLVSKARKGEISEKELVRQLNIPLKEAHEKYRDHKDSPYPVWERWRKLGIHLPKPLTWEFAESAKSDRLEDRLYKTLEHRIDQYTRFGVMEDTVFGSNVRFQNIKAMIDQDRITVFQADLTSPTQLEDLGKALRESKIEVSTVDASNVPGYFFNFGDSPRANFDRMVSGIQKLPLAKNSKFFFTESHPKRSEIPDGEDYWNYYSLPVTDINEMRNSYPEKLEKTKVPFPEYGSENYEQQYKLYTEFYSYMRKLTDRFSNELDKNIPIIYGPQLKK